MGSRITSNNSKDLLEVQNEKEALELLRQMEIETLSDLIKLINIVPDMICIAGTDGYFKYLNPEWEKVLGFTREELKSRPLFDFIHPDDHAPTQKEIERQIKGKATLNFQNRYRCKDGSYKTLEWRAIPAKKDKLFAVARDITERIRAEEQRHFMAQLLNSVRESVVATDLEGNVVYWGDGAKALYGYTADEMIGESITIIVEPGDGEVEKHRMEAVFEKGLWSGEYVQKRKDGSHFWADTVISLVKDKDGNSSGFIGIDRDITERKKTAEQLAQSLREAVLNQKEISALLKASQMVPVSKTFKEVAQNIFNTCSELTGARMGYVCLFSDDKKENTLLFIEPDEPDSDTVRGLLNLAGRFGEMAENPDKTVCNNNFPDSRWAKILPAGFLKNIVFIPLMINNSAAGVFGFANKPGNFTRRDVSIARAFGDMAAVGLTLTRYQDELRDNENRFRELFDNMSAGVAIYGSQDGGQSFIFEDLNKSGLKNLDRKSEEILGREVLEVFPEIKSVGLFDVFKRVWQTGKPEHHPVNIYQNGELKLWVENYICKLPSGKLVTIYEDTTARMKTEKALEESEKKYRSMMEALDELVYICSPDFTIEYMNPSMIRWAGYDAIGEACHKTLHGFDTQCPWCVHGQVMDGVSKTIEVVSPRDKKTYLVSNSPIFHTSGKISKLTIFRDITEIKSMRQRLQQAQKMEAIGNLAGGIAHDFNNILFPIVGMSELLLDDLPPGSIEYENAKEIYRAGMRGGELVNQILTFSRQSEQRRVPVKVQQIIKEVLKLIRSTIPTSISISDFFQPDCGSIMANPTRIHQICVNLITNAYHAVEKKNGKIDVQVTEATLSQGELANSNLPAGGYVKLSVSDDGYGIPADLIEKIFDPYFTTKAPGKGTGLGLSVVYGAVKEHGGDIQVSSRIGHGTIFNVYFPLIGQFDENSGEQQVEDLETGTEKILLVDDEAAIVKLGKQMLEKLGYQVTEKTNSIDALKTFRSSPDSFDIIVTDMSMPGLTGMQLAKEILSIRPELPIVICTGFSERLNEEQVYDLGVKGFLMKPVSKAQISETIRKLLDQQSKPA